MIVVPRVALHGVALVVAVALLLPLESQAQSADGRASASTPDSTCSYRSCALAIVPRWNGLAVIQGTSGPQVANLNFFWPHSVARQLAGGAANEARDSMAAHANRALGLRRAGAVLTDAGLGAAVLVGARLASRGRLQRDDKAIAATGLASMLLSIPLQFAADGELSRAVWWHNARFVR
jgi:hypothetical protein